MDNNIPQVVKKLKLATRMLVKEGVLDAFGHLSVRSSPHGGRYCMLCENRAAPAETEAFVELDKESDPVCFGSPRPSMERFIHGEIYRARPDVGAVAHTHAPALIPFGVTSVKLEPLYHMCGFLASGAPVFDTEDLGTGPDMLVATRAAGKALADRLGACAVVLMRGHGATIVGASLEEVVFRTLYTVINAQVQATAMHMGKMKPLSLDEGLTADDLHRSVLRRPWSFLSAKWSL